MALKVGGDLEEHQLDLEDSLLIRDVSTLPKSSSSFLVPDIILSCSPDCLYSVECKIVPFGCLFCPSTCEKIEGLTKIK